MPFRDHPLHDQGSIDLDDLGWSRLSVAGSRIAMVLQYRTGGIWLLQ